MQPLIHKASVNLTAKALPPSVCPGDTVHLHLHADATITAALTIPSRLPFGLGRPREFIAGTLGHRATELIKPAMEQSAHLRVRVVEVEPAHLSRTGRSRLYVSVWGDPQVLMSQKPRISIFSQSRINDGPVGREHD